MKNYIGGKWVNTDCMGYLDVGNPSNGEIIGKVPMSTTEEIDRTIDVAHKIPLRTGGIPQYPVARRVR